MQPPGLKYHCWEPKLCNLGQVDMSTLATPTKPQLLSYCNNWYCNWYCWYRYPFAILASWRWAQGDIITNNYTDPAHKMIDLMCICFFMMASLTNEKIRLKIRPSAKFTWIFRIFLLFCIVSAFRGLHRRCNRCNNFVGSQSPGVPACRRVGVSQLLIIVIPGDVTVMPSGTWSATVWQLVPSPKKAWPMFWCFLTLAIWAW